MSVRVRFEAELLILDGEQPETLDYASLQQVVQDQVGHTGVVVIDVTEYAEETGG